MDDTRLIVLVTGATRGIGAAIAEVYASMDVRRLLTGTDTEQIAQLNADSNRLTRYLDVDFAHNESLARFLDQVESLERLDTCINCAGINIIKPLEEVSDADFERLTDVNYRAPYLLSRAAARVMKRSGGGRIVNIGSIWSVIAKPGRTLYSASKAGLAGLTRALAVELAPDGILVNCVSPGFVLTDLTRDSLTPQQQEELAMQVPIRRFANPEEIARVVTFLAGRENTYITGQNVVVDGGFSIV